jgi:hypothetical protein
MRIGFQNEVPDSSFGELIRPLDPGEKFSVQLFRG